ncbi:MAG: hypothetical protein II661_06820 [Bacteroidales bacterium]|nr:hypothetical protein [Bacteroidales bacterium]
MSARNIGSGVTSRSSSSSSSPSAPAATAPASPAAGSPRRRNTSPLPAVAPAIPDNYTVPDNAVQILDSDEPGLGFGVNPRARDILGRALATAQTEALPRPTNLTIDRMDAVRAIMANQPERPAVREDNGLLPVWPRYAGAVTSGLLGLHNAFQEPDRYEIPEYTPVLPQARMHFIDPIYNPLDQNQAVNDVLAANAGTARAITNSGLGASTQATLLANDYNAGRNMGAARAQIWDANNQRLNDVIARRNQNAGMLGQFDYGQSRDRAYIKNDAAWKNLQMALQEQQLNYAAEGQKYAAIQNQIDSVAQALSNIGRENAAMNMVNGDEAYRYALSRLFDPYYKGNYGKCGGYIKKIKK